MSRGVDGGDPKRSMLEVHGLGRSWKLLGGTRVTDALRDISGKSGISYLEIVTFEDGEEVSVGSNLPLLEGYDYAVRQQGDLDVQIQGRPRRTFAAGHPVNPRDHYFIMPNVDELFNNLTKGKFCVLCSRRQSGKTTAALVVRNRLIQETDIFPVWLEGLEVAAKNWRASDMWSDLCQRLHKHCPSLFGAPGESSGLSADFRDLFRKTILTRKVALIMDDADSLLCLPAECIDDFFHAIRTIKQLPHEYNLKSFLLVGVETVKDLLEARYNHRVSQAGYAPSSTPSPLSPFPHDVAPHGAGAFTVEDVISLLQQRNEEHAQGAVFQDVAEIAAVIMSLTSGHRGLVGTCLSYLEQEKALDIKSCREVIDAYKLGNYIFGQATYSRIMQFFRKWVSDSREGHNLLVKFLEEGEQAFDQLYHLRPLLAQGVLAVKPAEGESRCIVDISSPLLRTEILRRSLFVDQAVGSPPNPYVVDRQWLILEAIKTLDGDLMCRPECLNVSSLEYRHQFVFMSRIKAIFCQAYPQVQYAVLPEAKEVEIPGCARSQMRLDTLIRDDPSLQRLGFELLVNASQANAELHEKCAETYSRQHNAQVCMINFTNQPGGGICITPKSDAVYSILVNFDAANRMASVICRDVHGMLYKDRVTLVSWTGRLSFDELV